MIALKAHFDGKVLVPDEPLNLPVNQQVQLLLVESIGSQANRTEPAQRTNFSEWIGLGLRDGPLNPNPRFPDDDSLWEGSIGATITNDPRKKKPR